jgi:hypothetical protein
MHLITTHTCTHKTHTQEYHTHKHTHNHMLRSHTYSTLPTHPPTPAEPDVVLLDDPLSALDARVGRRVYDLGVRQARPPPAGAPAVAAPACRALGPPARPEPCLSWRPWGGGAAGRPSGACREAHAPLAPPHPHLNTQTHTYPSIPFSQALAGRTVLLATNQLQFATHPAVDRIVFMRGGRAEEVGTLEELMAIPGGGFAALVRETQLEEEQEEEGAGEAAERLLEGDDLDALPPTPPGEAAAAADGGAGKPGGGAAAPAAGAAAAAAAAGGGGGRLVQAEGSRSGRVGFDVVSAYVAWCGGWGVIGALGSVYVAGEALRVGTTLWLSYWTSESPAVFFWGG